MKKCKKSNSNCGTILSSYCVDYEGEELKSVNKETDQCDLSVTDAIELIDKELKKVKDGLDTKKLTKLCLDTISKDDTVIIIINKLISEICTLTEQLKETETKLETLDILSLTVDVDSDCLSGTHCSTDPTLRSLLIKIISELCLLKSQVNNSNNSSTIFGI